MRVLLYPKKIEATIPHLWANIPSTREGIHSMESRPKGRGFNPIRMTDSPLLHARVTPCVNPDGDSLWAAC